MKLVVLLILLCRSSSFASTPFGQSSVQSSQPAQLAQLAQPAQPSIGEMLLAKDGWLKKHQDGEDDVNGMQMGLGVAGNRRGGLGFNDHSSSQNSYRSDITQKTLDRLNKL